MRAQTKSVIFYGASLGLILVLGSMLLPALLPPRRTGLSFAMQTSNQRMIVQDRVRSAGGWMVLRHDCESMVTKSYPIHPQWFPPRTNAHVYELTNGKPFKDYITNIDYGSLPFGVACLQPHEIEYCAVPNGPTVVQIKLFGLNRSGGMPIPNYSLWVACGDEWSKYTPAIKFEPDHGSLPSHGFNKVSDGVFEVY
jgi:hypothetical protein